MSLRKKALLYLVSIAGALLLAGVVLLAALWWRTPLPSSLHPANLLQTTYIYDARGGLLTSVFTENREVIPLESIPIEVQHAFVAMEDARFYQHHGIDLRGILRSVWVNIRNRRIMQGGSTITQQVARNFYLSPERTLRRKLTEAVLAVKIERRYSKHDILEAYLNQVYFGAGAYGVSVAARVYFDKPAGELTVPEGALLAGLIRAPSRYSPWNSPELALTRERLALRRMAETGYITEAEAHAWGVSLPAGTSTQPSLQGKHKAPYFTDYVLKELLKLFPSQMIYGGGLRVRTTLEPHMQMTAERSLRSVLAGKPRSVQAGLVMLDPATGRLLAMVGGRDYAYSQFNRSWQAGRQPGSAFKIFTYTTAVRRGYPVYTLLNDIPTAYNIGGSIWRPHNYSGGFSGVVTMRRALEQSMNVASVDLFVRLGAESVIRTAADMGIQSDLPAYLSLSLGSASVNVLEMTGAVSVLANGGYRVEPTVLTKIYDYRGRRLYQEKISRLQVLDPAVCYIMTDLMRGVISRGTGRRAAFGMPAAGKTGTSSDHRDGWFVGFTPRLAAGVWVGRDDNKPVPGLVGGGFPAAVWRGAMSGSLRGSRAPGFSRPPGVERITICRDSGQLARPFCPRKVSDMVLTRAAPTSLCPLHTQEPLPPADQGGDVPLPPGGPVAGPSRPPEPSPPDKPEKPSDPAPAPERPRQPGIAPPGEPPQNFFLPGSGIVSMFVCEASGDLPSAGCLVLTRKSFFKGREPRSRCRLHGR